MDEKNEENKRKKRGKRLKIQKKSLFKKKSIKMSCIFKTYFSFHNHATTLIEVKRLDIVEEEVTDKGKLFFWLLVDHDSLHVDKLIFKAMGKSEDAQWREFAQGRLEFNKEEATFQGSQKFTAADGSSIQPRIISAIENFLKRQE